MAINSDNNLEMTDKADASKPPAKRWVYVIPVAVVMYMLAYLDRTNTAMILPYITQIPLARFISPRPMRAS